MASQFILAFTFNSAQHQVTCSYRADCRFLKELHNNLCYWAAVLPALIDTGTYEGTVFLALILLVFN